MNRPSPLLLTSSLAQFRRGARKGPRLPCARAFSNRLRCFSFTRTVFRSVFSSVTVFGPEGSFFIAGFYLIFSVQPRLTFIHFCTGANPQNASFCAPKDSFSKSARFATKMEPRGFPPVPKALAETDFQSDSPFAPAEFCFLRFYPH